ncbi:MAG: hypothetical protein JW832_04460 [Deltaproteobacteria bacterium]|nr:hypothetical protein [Deltaproteobacteria bacterium]
MYKAAVVTKHFDITGPALHEYCSAGIIESDQECTKEEIFRILCAKCLTDSGAGIAQIKMILSAVHPSRHLNVGVYTPHDGMLTVFFVPHSNTDQRRYALDQIWKIQNKSRVSVVINFEKIISDIEAVLGPFIIKGGNGKP